MHELARFTIFGNLIGAHGRPQRCRACPALFHQLYRGRAVVPRLGERLYVSSRITLDFFCSMSLTWLWKTWVICIHPLPISATRFNIFDLSIYYFSVSPMIPRGPVLFTNLAWEIRYVSNCRDKVSNSVTSRFSYPLRVIHSLLWALDNLSLSFARTQHLIVLSVWKFREAISKHGSYFEDIASFGYFLGLRFLCPR